jgi:hypothetical protein
MKLFAPVLAAATSAAWVAAAAPAAAPALPFEPIRGVVAQINGKQIVLKSKGGGMRTIDLAPDWSVQLTKPIAISEIREGSFIGTSEMPQEDGSGRSLEVHVFPPGVKMGEGHYDWNLRKGSKMTNGTVGKVTAGAKGRELEVTYSTGVRRIVVPPTVPVVQITNGERAMVKVGIPVFLVAVGKPGGGAVARSIAVGVNGAKPPM